MATARLSPAPLAPCRPAARGSATPCSASHTSPAFAALTGAPRGPATPSSQRMGLPGGSGVAGPRGGRARAVGGGRDEDPWWVSVVDDGGDTVLAPPTKSMNVGGVTVSMSAPSINSRRVWAAVDVAASAEDVWACLTDYDHLGDFVPSLAENRVLNRRPGGVRLFQVGQQDVALGAKFRARATLEIDEVPEGLLGRWTREQCKAAGRMVPPDASAGPGSRSLVFSLAEGDFQSFDGTWHMEAGTGGAGTSRLLYIVRIQPQMWLPVLLVEGRILKDVGTNIAAVGAYAAKRAAAKGQGMAAAVR